MTHATRARKERGAKIVAIDIYRNGTMQQADLAQTPQNLVGYPAIAEFHRPKAFEVFQLLEPGPLYSGSREVETFEVGQPG